MGRPAYVLVARQMGKTNLLLHAKRRASSSDIFVYADVSNVVPDLRSFLRGIVDSCVDECENRELQEVIENGRRSSNAQLEHREHERELREVLRFVSGKVVIFLDEIDALTRVSYSDKVFSFIRSIYFSGRTNFPSFERLTYVLSGVAEPSEIIKNRDISPFNIGEKIYLDDFSREEFERFLLQADLSWPEDVVDRLYYWTSGNPRLTWDVVSAVESTNVRVESVDSSIQQLYLNSFDLPPVDHIRTLAKADKEIRSAVMSIHYGKADQIPDSVLSKLYLAGIVSVAAQGEELRIKNRVIELSLSEKWLSDTEMADVPSLSLAVTLYEEGRYLEAIDIYSALEKAGVSRDPELFSFRKAQCLFALGDYQGALEHIQVGIYPRSKSLDLYLASSALCGSIQLILGKLSDSIISLERVVREAVANDLEQPAIIVKSKLNLAAAYLKLETPNFDKARELCLSVVSAISVVAEQDGAITQADSDALTAAHFNIYRSFRETNDPVNARQHLAAAISRARPSERPSLMLEDLDAFESGQGRELTLQNCVRHCIDAWLPLLDVFNVERPLSFRYPHASKLCYELALINGDSEILHEFIEFCGRADVGHKVSVYTMLAMSAVLALKSNHAEARGTVDRILSKASSIEADDDDGGKLLITCLSVTYLSNPDLYAAGRIFSSVASIGRVDLPLYVYSAHRVSWYLIENGELSDAKAILEKLPKISPVDGIAGESVFDLIGDYFEVVADIKSALEIECARIVDLYKRLCANVLYTSGFYDADDLAYMKQELLRRFPKYLTPSKLISSKAEYGRNQLVTVVDSAGVARTVKFKKVEADLQSGVLTLVVD